MRHLKLFLIFIFLIPFFQKIRAQEVVLKGNVTDTSGNAVSRINILVFLPGNRVLAAFGVTDNRGNFQIKLNKNIDSLDVQVSSVQYRNVYRRIANKSQFLRFTLESEVMQLKTVTVKAPVIEKRGDTISYLVHSFARKEDQSIEDVLRRMPGIEIEPGGRILYQGLPVQKFYVEGLDLMNGRYSMVSKNLPYRSVSAVEILENHQPIRILENRVPSAQASLNIKLKHNIAATGTAKLGAGFSPVLRDVNITPMFFTKNFQVVASYQSNNTGNDVSKQLNVLTFSEILENAERPAKYPEFLNIQSALRPDVPEEHYLDNNINLLNFNGLIRLNRDFQLRANIYYINDRQKEQATLFRTLYTSTDTLSFVENINNRLQGNYLYTEFSLTRNVKKNYFNDELKLESHSDNGTGVVLTDDNDVQQSLKNPFKFISNELHSVNPLGKHLIRFNSYMSYDYAPQRLMVMPGQFANVLNHGIPYDTVLQKTELTRFYADHSAEMIFSWKRFNFSNKTGVAYRNQVLRSNLFVTHQQMSEADSGFTNKIRGEHLRAYFNTGITFRLAKMTFKAGIPFSWQKVDLNDLEYGNKQGVSRFLFDPHLSVDYKTGGFWRMRFTWNYGNRLGDIDNVYYGFILLDYRNLSQNAAPISQTAGQNWGLYLSYRNPVISFFNSLSFTYSLSSNNLIYRNITNPDGTSVLQAFPFHNAVYTLGVHGQSSKYIPKIRSTVAFRADYRRSKGQSLMNDELFYTTTVLYNLKPGLNIRFTNWMNADYNLRASFIRTDIENEKKREIVLYQHRAELFFFPDKHQTVNVSSEYYKSEDANNLFVNLLYDYQFTRRKVKLELKWSNIFNNKTYLSYRADAFTVWESTYLLRPSQFLVSVKFNY